MNTRRSRKFVYEWRDCVISSDLSATTRHVLLTLSLHMTTTGENCFPTIEQISYETGLGRTTIIKHLGIAECNGWVLKKLHGYGGQRWRNNLYRPEIPNGRKAVPWKESQEFRIRRKNSLPSKQALFTKEVLEQGQLVEEGGLAAAKGGSYKGKGSSRNASNVVLEVNTSSSFKNPTSSSKEVKGGSSSILSDAQASLIDINVSNAISGDFLDRLQTFHGYTPTVFERKRIIQQAVQWVSDGVTVEELDAAVICSRKQLKRKGDECDPPVAYIAKVLAGNRDDSYRAITAKTPCNHSGFAKREYAIDARTHGFNVVGG